MSNHKIHFAGLEPHLQARCSCKQRSPIGTRADVEEWKFSHEQLIQRVRAHLGARNITLKSAVAWFVSQAENEDNTPEDRALWRQLADEAGAHLERKEHALDQDPLF